MARGDVDRSSDRAFGPRESTPAGAPRCQRCGTGGAYVPVGHRPARRPWRVPEPLQLPAAACWPTRPLPRPAQRRPGSRGRPPRPTPPPTSIQGEQTAHGRIRLLTTPKPGSDLRFRHEGPRLTSQTRSCPVSPARSRPMSPQRQPARAPDPKRGTSSRRRADGSVNVHSRHGRGRPAQTSAVPVPSFRRPRRPDDSSPRAAIRAPGSIRSAASSRGCSTPSRGADGVTGPVPRRRRSVLMNETVRAHPTGAAHAPPLNTRPLPRLSRGRGVGVADRLAHGAWPA